MSAVTLTKTTDGEPTDTREGNAGTGRIMFIGGIPTRPVGGPLILVAGMRVNLPEEKGMSGVPRTVAAVAVAVERDGFRDADETVPSYRGVVITAEGGRYPTGPLGTMEYVRREWLRLAVESGTFRRVARMS